MAASKLRTTAVVAVSCAAVGAVAGIAGTAASPRQAGSPSPGAYGGEFRHHRHPPFGPAGPVVHAVAVVLDRARTGFVTVTTDSGKVKSVAGDQLTITEGAGGVTYEDVTLTIPADATIRRDFAKATLADLEPGDFVRVASSSEGTFVFAMDPTARPPRGRFAPDDRHPDGAAPPDGAWG
jgi:hypothetical protein